MLDINVPLRSFVDIGFVVHVHVFMSTEGVSLPGSPKSGP